MNILLDSSALIDLIKGKIELDASNRHYINPIVYSEVLYGLLYVGKSEGALISFLDEHGIEVLAIGKETASLHSQIKLALNKKGQPLPDNDLLVASSCLEHNFTLYTLNKKHFKRIGDLRILSD